MPSLADLIAQVTPRATEFRRDLHQHPELGYQEVRTSSAVRQRLSELNISHQGDLAGGTGVLAYLPATQPGGSCIALRADMDALPISEESGVPHSSKTPGVMHACGHDGHTSILLATAEVLSQVSRPNDVLFVFQPAEEGGAGGDKMVKDGVLDGSVLGKPVQHIYGLHGFPTLHIGEVSSRVGPLMASASQFRLVIRGKGAHAAYPHHGIDPIVVTAHIVTALQTIASRTIDPLDSVVVTVGKIEAGVAHNVIPETATLHGTVRTLNDATYELAHRRVGEIASQVAAAFGATAELQWLGAYPVTRNHPEATRRFFEIARNTLGEQPVFIEEHPSMGGEDFSFYGQKVPACFFFLGLHENGAPPVPNLHSPYFDFNDRAIPTGIQLFAYLALTAL